MRYNAQLLPLLLMFLASLGLQAQINTRKKQETPTEIKKAATKLEKSLSENDNPQIARDYEFLAQELADKNDPAKAEEYLFKALEVYTAATDGTGRARVLRNIAKVQESQNKLKAAARNYKAAMGAATDKVFKTLNSNDYNRLKNFGSTEAENKYLDANIALLKKVNKKSEVADAYLQQAVLSLKINDTIAALEKYSQAVPYASGIPGKAIRVYEKIAKLHVAGKRFEEAIPIVQELLVIVRKINDIDTEVAQLQYLATIYFDIGDTESAVNTLKEAYKIASSNGRTFDAREILLHLADHYKGEGDDRAAIEIYEAFLQNLDRIILSDKSLTDARTFRVTEERIRTLENEKALKDELITRKNTFNYFLLGFMAVMVLLLISIVKALYAIKTKNKEIALQSLRREMNPHFLFNSLNSVNQFIAQNNELQANKYLTSYSTLMRNTMENSNKDFVTLGNEIENLTQYLELEHLRFKDKFDYVIKVDANLDRDSIWIPNMMIQPHLENAIWHGLRYKDGKGILKVDFLLNGKEIIITVDDDGIGPTKSMELKTENQKAHQSRGLTNTRERMTLINKLYKTKITFTVTEKTVPDTGTIVRVTFPIINKP